MRQLLPLIAFLLVVAVMCAVLFLGPELVPEHGLILAVLSITGITLLSGAGLFDSSLIRYSLYSVLIQFGYFALDVSTAFLIKKSIWFAILQFINFAVAGLLFAIAITLLYGAVRREGVPDYAGVYHKNQFAGIALVISCLSLGGMPGFNIFVGEFVIYSSLFTVHPALAMAAVFASLVCFLFYFRMCYVIFAGESETELKTGAATKIAMAGLAFLTVALGMVPQILLKILEWYA